MRQYEFKDLFDLESIRKGFGEMLEYDIAKMINEVNVKAMKEKDTKRGKDRCEIVYERPAGWPRWPCWW